MAVVIGAAALAAEFAAAGLTLREEVLVLSHRTGRDIRAEWRAGIPTGSGGYQGAGFTSSGGANKAHRVNERNLRGLVGVEVFNQSFVASWLQNGTVNQGPKYDLIGAAEPYVETWLDDVYKAAGL